MQQTAIDEKFQKISAKMKAADCSAASIAQFYRAYQRLVRGETGLIAESDIEPLEHAEDLDTLGGYEQAGAEALASTCIVKLNGGLGTSMGLDRAKSLLVVKNELSFLDIIVRQTLHLRKKYDCQLPLIFMNSFRTEADTLEVLSKYPTFAEGQNELPVSFLQNKVPKITADEFEAVDWPEDPSLEWCPPGHGDIYLALADSGILAALVARGYRQLFISNSDNLGAVLDLNLLGYFAQEQPGLLMEVADRTAADSKGGHVARGADGRLLLRESAQCPADEQAEFQNTQKYKYFNTNSLWIDIQALLEEMQRSEGGIDLPLIKNLKTVDPIKAQSPKVYQLETAMGAALASFTDATVLRVPRTRFAPVKKTEDLLGLRSDAFVIGEDYRIELAATRDGMPPLLRLDPRYYAHVDQFEQRFPKGVPSLLRCEKLEVEGDVAFGPKVVVEGKARIINSQATQQEVSSGSHVSGELQLGAER